MAYAVFNHEKLNIGVDTCIDSDIEWLKEFLCPAFSVTASKAEISIQLQVDPDLYQSWFSCGPGGSELKTFMLDTQVISFPVWSVPINGTVVYDQGHEVFYHVDGKQIVILGNEQKKKTRTRLMRVVREIVMGVAQSNGGRLLHASAFALAGRAIIVTGPKEAGKTSLLTYALIHSGASYLTNDRLLVRFQEQTTRLSGIPTIVSIRPGTFKLFPEVQKKVIERRFQTQSTLRECQQMSVPQIQYRPNGNLGLSPAQWCALFDCSLVNDLPAGAILFPKQTRRSGGLSIQRLDVEETVRRLEACMFGNIKPDSLSEVFTTFPPGFNKQKPMNDGEFSFRLARSVDAYECLMGVDAFKNNQGFELLRTMISSRNNEKRTG